MQVLSTVVEQCSGVCQRRGIAWQSGRGSVGRPVTRGAPGDTANCTPVSLATTSVVVGDVVGRVFCVPYRNQASTSTCQQNENQTTSSQSKH